MRNYVKKPNRQRVAVAAAVLSFAAGIMLLALAGARALPRHSARYEQNCNLCHVNPTGGGMRSTYASQFIVPEELAWGTLGDDALAGIDPEIANNITIGADFRMIYFYSDDDLQSKNFFQMQGDIYLNFQMSDQLALYFDSGISTRYELFGTAYILPNSGYVKVGRFIPAFGWKFDDHTMYTRDFLGFFPPGHTDVGMELGWYPNNFALHASVLNGNRGGTFDDNRDLGVALRGLYRFNLWNMGMSVGASGYHNRESDGDHDVAGTFGYYTWKGFAWVGEVDLYRFDPVGTDEATTSLVMSNEFAYLIRKGLELKATYDFFDADKDLKSGSQQRVGAGVFVMPSPFLGLEALVRATDFTNGPDLTGDDFYELIAQFHFLY